MMDDLISRKAAIDAMEGVDWYHINKDGQLVHGANSDDHEPLYKAKDVYAVLNTMSSAQPEIKPISYEDCANAMLMMWMDNVVTDGEYSRIMDKLNDHEKKQRSDERSDK